VLRSPTVTRKLSVSLRFRAPLHSSSHFLLSRSRRTPPHSSSFSFSSLSLLILSQSLQTPSPGLVVLHFMRPPLARKLRCMLCFTRVRPYAIFTAAPSFMPWSSQQAAVRGRQALQKCRRYQGGSHVDGLGRGQCGLDLVPSSSGYAYRNLRPPCYSAAGFLSGLLLSRDTHGLSSALSSVARNLYSCTAKLHAMELSGPLRVSRRCVYGAPGSPYIWT
jgi:hypothetical protein